MTARGVETAGTNIVGSETVDELFFFCMLIVGLKMGIETLTSDFEPAVFNCLLLHSALRSAILRGKYCDACLE